MKRILFFLLLIIVCSLALIIGSLQTLAVVETGYSSSTSNVQLIAESVSPDPVEPGQDVTVQVRIYNRGGATAKNVDIKLHEAFPFHLKSKSQEFREPQDLCVGCSKSSSFYLVVDADAVSGIYPITFTSYVDGNIGNDEKVNIRVSGKPDIVFESPSVDNLVKPGDMFKINIVLTNIGTGKARNIKIIPRSSDFINLGSGLHVVKELKSDNSATVELEFSVGEDVIPDSYNIPIEFEFLDEEGNVYIIAENLGVKLADYGEVFLQNWKLTPQTIKQGQEFTLQIRLENVGAGDAKNVKAVLETPLRGSKETYLGRLKKDDDAPGVFTLVADQAGIMNNRLIVTYTDDFGSHELVEEFSITVGKSYRTILLVIGAVLALAFIILYIVFFRNSAKVE